MADPTQKEFHTTNYMHNFHCIGQACGDHHCCQQWKIGIDHDNYKKLKRVMDRIPEDKELFKKRIKRNRSSLKDDKIFATFILDSDTKCCNFFDERGLCEIHGRFGEEYLCQTCSIYPRKINDFPDRQELTAQLSCPEVARLCLLHENSTDSGPVDASKYSTKGMFPSNDTRKLHTPYATYVHDIRNILNQFLSLADFPLTSRLFFISYLANRTAPFFNTKGTFTEDQLAAEIDRITKIEMLQDLHSGYQDLDADLQIPMQLINSLLSARGQRGLPSGLLKGIIKTYGLAEKHQELVAQNVTDESGEVEADAHDVLATYQRRKNKLTTKFSKRLDLIFTNFCKNHIYCCPYTDDTDLLHAMQGLLARLTTVNFLLFSHPDLDIFIDDDKAPKDPQATEKIFDSIVIDVFYRFSRTLEHNPGVWKRVFSETDKTNMATFALLTQLLKFSDDH